MAPGDLQREDQQEYLSRVAACVPRRQLKGRRIAFRECLPLHSERHPARRAFVPPGNRRWFGKRQPSLPRRWVGASYLPGRKIVLQSRARLRRCSGNRYELPRFLFRPPWQPDVLRGFHLFPATNQAPVLEVLIDPYGKDPGDHN